LKEGDLLETSFLDYFDPWDFYLDQECHDYVVGRVDSLVEVVETWQAYLDISDLVLFADYCACLFHLVLDWKEVLRLQYHPGLFLVDPALETIF
jgi:hypothetical protein